MKQIVIISHKSLAQGMAETINFFVGNDRNVHFICAYQDGENEFPRQKLTNLITTFNSKDQIFLLTDLLGGSVNQNCIQLIDEQHINVITGINLALALSIILDPSEYLSTEKIIKLITQAQNQMVYMNVYSNNDEADDE